MKNGYSENFIDACFASFVDKDFNKLPNIITAPKRIIYFSFPFTGLHSIEIQSKLTNFSHLPVPN